MNETLALLQSHRSIRRFAPRPVPDDLVREIVACGQAAASSHHGQAVTVIQVKDPARRERLAQVAGGQDYVTGAGAFLVFCADLNRAREACGMHGADFRGGMTEHFIQATVDTALAAQNCVVAAESLGLGICYIGALRNDPQAVTALLELPEFVYPVFGLCLGWPDQDPERKPRLPMDLVLRQDRYGEPGLRAGIEAYDREMREYYRTRSGGAKDSSWSAEVAGMAGRAARPHMRGFLAGQGFTLD